MTYNPRRNTDSRVREIGLLLGVAVFLASCSTSLVNLEPGTQEPDTGQAIVVGSFLVDPVQEWQDAPDKFWLSIWKSPAPRKEYTISLQPGQEEDVLIELPAGIYEIAAIYEGNPGLMSRGHGYKGELGLWFEIEEEETVYIGRLRFEVSKEPDLIRRNRAAAVEANTRVITTAIFGHSVSAMPKQPVMYTAATIEDDLPKAVAMLQDQGWSESSIGRLKTSLITTAEPD